MIGNMAGIDENDRTELPSVENVLSPYDVPQNNYVLPRNLFTSGTLPGNTVIKIGDKQIIIDGKNSQITVGSLKGQHFILDGNLNRIDFYDQTGTNVGYIVGDYLEGQGIIISKGTFSGTMLSNADMQVRGPFQVGILGTDGVINLLSGNSGSAKINATSGDLTIDCGGLIPLITFNKPIYVNGTIYATDNISTAGNVYGANKYFLIPHPTKKDKKLQYSTLETPEVLLMCRGNGKVKLSDHFIAMTEPDTLQTIQDKENGNWLVTGIRKGFKDFDCEPSVI